jgi:hypothetical protein
MLTVSYTPSDKMGMLIIIQVMIWCLLLPVSLMEATFFGVAFIKVFKKDLFIVTGNL